MKPHRNFLFVESRPASESANSRSPMEKLAETYCPKGFVYLARKGQPELQDTDNGVRLMPFKNGESLPYLQQVEAIFVDGSAELLESVRRSYPGAPVFHWDSTKPSRRDKILRLFQQEQPPRPPAAPQQARAIA